MRSATLKASLLEGGAERSEAEGEPPQGPKNKGGTYLCQPTTPPTTTCVSGRPPTRSYAPTSTKTTQSEFSALSADVQQIQADLTKITIGSYTGNGNVTRSFNLGVYPQAVLIMCSYGAAGYHYSRFMHLGGLALRGKPAKTQQGDVFISVTSNGFSVSDEGHDNGCSVLLNYSEYVYYYVVFS